MTGDKNFARDLSQIIDSTFKEEFRQRGKIGILFSGGVDSALMALLAKKVTNPRLYATGIAGAKDLKSAREVADELELDLKTIVLTEQDVLRQIKVAAEILEDYDVLDIELTVPLAACAKQAVEDDLSSLAMGQGAEELFAGYRRHEQAYQQGEDLNSMLRKEVEQCKASEITRDEQVMGHYGLKGIYPFLNQDVIDFALNIPAELKIKGDYKKWVLRQAAKELGVPEAAWTRPKSALQYGSGVHKLIDKKARKTYRDVEQVKREGYHGPIDKWLRQIWRETI